MARKKITEEEVVETITAHVEEVAKIVNNPKTEKELLTECYEFMKSRAINSISDIENKLARA